MSTSRRRASEAEAEPAFALKRAGRSAEAARAFAELALRFPEDRAVVGVLAGLYQYELKRPDLAIPLWQRILAAVPTNERASVCLFHALDALGDEMGAFRELLRFQSISHSDDFAEIFSEAMTHEYYRNIVEQLRAEGL